MRRETQECLWAWGPAGRRACHRLYLPPAIRKHSVAERSPQWKPGPCLQPQTLLQPPPLRPRPALLWVPKVDKEKGVLHRTLQRGPAGSSQGRAHGGKEGGQLT